MQRIIWINKKNLKWLSFYMAIYCSICKLFIYHWKNDFSLTYKTQSSKYYTTYIKYNLFKSIWIEEQIKNILSLLKYILF